MSEKLTICLNQFKQLFNVTLNQKSLRQFIIRSTINVI